MSSSATWPGRRKRDMLSKVAYAGRRKRDMLSRITRAVRRFDWGLCLALALALVAAAPFLTRPGLPRQTDTELHVYRAAELGHTLRAGVFYPRWAPDLYYGYGYPIFNYYASLTYYLANAFDLLPGVDIVGGVKAVFVLGLVLASAGAYLLGREFSGFVGGVLAAASFTFAPYVVFIDPHARGDLAEHFALCLLPVGLYAFHRLMSGAGGGRGALLGSVLSLAAIVFSHNLMGLIAGVLLFGYWVWLVLESSGLNVRRDRMGWGALAFILAAAIVAFFWLPFFLERSAIKLEVIDQKGGHFDFRNHFLTLGELLAPSRILDLGATAPRFRHNLGLAQWLLALPALAALAYFGTRKILGPCSPTPPHFCALTFFALAFCGLLLLMLPISTTVWEHIPGMRYLQFPWRLLGPANLMLAVCAAGSLLLLPTGRWNHLLAAICLLAVLLLSLPVLYPPGWSPNFGGVAPQDIIAWEQESYALGTTSTGDFLPVRAALGTIYPAQSLLDSYTQPGPVDRVNRAALPEGTRVEVVEQRALYDHFSVYTPEEFVFRLYLFYFPGWRVYVDSEEVEINVAKPEGFITVFVPAGEHDVIVRFEDTPPRIIGRIVSACGLGGLVVTLILMRSTVPCLQSPIPNLQSLLWLGGVLMLFIFLKSAVIDPQEGGLLRYTSPPGQAQAAQHEVHANFGGQIELLGYDLPKPRVRPGEALPLVLYWRALTPMGENYQTFVHVAQPLHLVWAQQDRLNPGNFPTSRWPLDRYVWDAYEIRIPFGTPPGEYMINVGVPSWEGGYRLPRVDEDGQSVGDGVMIAAVEVLLPHRQPDREDLNMTDAMVAFPEAGITLMGHEAARNAYLSEEWQIEFFWQADRDNPSMRVRDLVLLDDAGEEVWRISGEPTQGVYPVEDWQEGEVVRDPLRFDFTLEEFELGEYQIGVVVSGEAPFKPEGSSETLLLLASLNLKEAK
jgi:hypothetical protein